MKINSADIKNFWNEHPVATAGIPYRPGTREFFRYYDAVRERKESAGFSDALHEYGKFSGKKVLDVGCGNGYVLDRYAREGAEVYGVDITEAAVDICRKRFELSGLHGEFHVANAEKLPFPDGTFDCVCSMGVLHHVSDPEKAVSEICRVMKSGGRLIVMVYHRDSCRYRVRMKIESMVTGKSLERLVNEGDGIGNPKADVYSRDELRKLLVSFKDLDLSIRMLKGYHLFFKLGHFVPDLFMRPFERRWGWFLYAKGIKG